MSSEFDDFLRNNLSMLDYMNLKTILSNNDNPKSTHRITKIKNNPRIMDINELLGLSKHMKKDPIWFMKKFNCGQDNIKESEIEIMRKSIEVAKTFLAKSSKSGNLIMNGSVLTFSEPVIKNSGRRWYVEYYQFSDGVKVRKRVTHEANRLKDPAMRMAALENIKNNIVQELIKRNFTMTSQVFETL